MTPRLVFAIFRKDLRDGMRNYQVLLMLLTPIILSLLFNKTMGESRAQMHLPRIGVLGFGNQLFMDALSGKDPRVKFEMVDSRDELNSKVLEGVYAIGLVMPRQIGVGSGAVATASAKPVIEVLIGAGLPAFTRETLEATLTNAVRNLVGAPAPELPITLVVREIGEAQRHRSRTFAQESMPMIVLMALGMVGFIGLPMAFVEEKERKTLQALMLAPIDVNDLILGKSAYGLAMISVTVVAIVAINQQFGGAQWLFWTLVLLGSLLCLFVGLFIALFAESQATVNAIGTSLFLVFQLVPSLMMSSDTLRLLAPFVPSTFLQDGMKKALFYDLSLVPWQHDLGAMVAWTLGAYLVLYLSLRYRRHHLL